MLAAYIDIKPKPRTDALVQPSPASKPDTPPKKGKTRKAPARLPKKVEPYETGTVHARFKPSAQCEPPGVCEDGQPGQPTEEEAQDETQEDSFEYLWQDADRQATEEDDTDSCITFDDNASDENDVLGTSPVMADIAPSKLSFSKRKVRASEVPVYSGPELWYEDDEFE